MFNLLSSEFTSNSVVVFDEVYNIEDICTKVLTVSIKKDILQKAQRNLNKLQKV